MQTLKPRGYVIYRGPSILDGAPIAAVAITHKSANAKTGNMVQTYILRADVAPLDALKSGADASVCGDCKHRPVLGGACYVNVGQGPRSVYAAFTRGRYPVSLDAAREASRGRMVRLGTYGDPMAVPAWVWESLTLHAAGHTGYSHQWLNGDIDATQRDRVMQLCMASADTETEFELAHTAQLRTFRVRRPADPLLPGEFSCPASAEAGKRKTCATCGACDGSLRSRAASASIIAHGATASRFIRINAT
jgi:hypothetical protein